MEDTDNKNSVDEEEVFIPITVTEYQYSIEEIPELTSDDEDEEASENEEILIKTETPKLKYTDYIKTEEITDIKQESEFLVSSVIKLSKLINIRHMNKKDFKN